MNVYVRDLSREFGRRGIAVDVYTRSQDPCMPHIRDDLGINARVIHVPAGPESPVDKATIYHHIPDFVDGVLSLAEREGRRYDGIFSHYWLSGLVAERLRERWGIPFVQMFHTLGKMKNRIAQGLPERDSELRIAVESELVVQADRLLAATPAEKAQLLWLYGADPDKIRIVPPGVDLTRFQPRSKAESRGELGLQPGDRMVLFVGRIEPLKGVDTLIRAVALVKAEYPELARDLVLVIIGGNPSDSAAGENAEMDRLKALRLELGLTDLVTFLGAKDQDTLQIYYTAAEAVIMPSHYESFGMVALEAMACGTPVIASEVGGLAFLIRDGRTGFHVPDRDPRALADRMIRILSDPTLGQILGHQAMQVAQEYAWPRIADQLLEVFAELRVDRSDRWLPTVEVAAAR